MADTAPAPWRWESTEEGGSYIYAEDGQTIARVWASHPYDGEWLERLHATGRLLAAAPELLASCREMAQALADYEMDTDEPAPYRHRQMLERANKAIAAAIEGEVPECPAP